MLELKRPASKLTVKEKELIGEWEEVYNPNDSGLKQIGNLFVNKKLNVDREKIYFEKNKKFRIAGRNGKSVVPGVFYEREKDQKIKLFYKYNLDLDRVIRMEDNLIFLGKKPYRKIS